VIPDMAKTTIKFAENALKILSEKDFNPTDFGLGR
jgi:hypothetical protein